MNDEQRAEADRKMARRGEFDRFLPLIVERGDPPYEVPPRKDCELCDGAGEVSVTIKGDGYGVNCPACDGMGTVEAD